jgi:hypothetical protein
MPDALIFHRTALLCDVIREAEQEGLIPQTNWKQTMALPFLSEGWQALGRSNRNSGDRNI